MILKKSYLHSYVKVGNLNDTSNLMLSKLFYKFNFLINNS